MQREQTSTLGTPTPDRRPWLMTAATAALLVAAAIGVWRTADRREGTTTTAVEQTTAATAPAPAAGQAVATRSDALTVYVVGSAEEAARLTDALRAGDQILGQLGQPPFNAQVAVAASAEAEAAIVRAHGEVEAIRASMGLPPFALVNLRSR
jgi:hypothetical protein